ncbi:MULTISPECIES: fructose-specific PTS transporter subunit EIIC [Clostridia]|uniref:PTS fructose transporter subunit IIABC n=1 Tax=Clostridia TaxID=186801 RepID=UPI000E48E995|nr:fructose-specific PTS transporter subunit EIIC [Mediterraneibacter sp. NSJ-151]MCH4280038.1 fructose-specific PTS transporter subunit EIIC [Mediterraneibacter sp. NSJ-151]RHT34554.1 PTS fructose transporter subunit IIC [Firmicutes bacterium AM31-12AC]
MRIRDLLAPESICLNGAAADKKDVLNQMVDLMAKSGKVSDKENYLAAVFAREEEGTTGVGDGIAIPHGRCTGVNKPGLAAMVLPQGVEYEALDDEPVNLIFLIAAPEGAGNVHITILSKLSMMLMDDTFTESLRKAKSVEEFLNIIDAAETEKDDADAAKEKAAAQTDLAADKEKDNQKLILAVTACPTGIAHTYMAAESIEKAAKKKGYLVKVETRGSGGAKNVLTEEEIEAADGIIVAADTNVPMDRFDGKALIECQVSHGINKADELIDTIVSGQAEIYKAAAPAKKSNAQSMSGGVGHTIYKHLMNGVSHMLPFVVGGGILIAIAFLIDGLCVDLNALSAAERANFGTITPIAATFKTIGGVAFGFMLPILAGFIAMSIADRPGLVAGFVGGAIAANGTSGFLGALAAGFLAGFIVNLIKKVCEKLPDSLEGIKPVLLYPVFGVLLMGLSMTFIIEPIVGVINTGLNNGLGSLSGMNAVLLGAILGGMMSIDMGGPFNKAAYVFGTASIAAGNYNIMAAVMVGGMVAPCAIALATLLFKNKFTVEERKSGPTNFVMGLSFITEGAIPFAASDPLHVLPSCIVGSALAGALSMAFNCTLMAPHGGIFVFPVVGNPIMYVVALVAGTIVGAILLGILKKTVENE